MRQLKKTVILKIAMMLCVVVQVVVMMPHHHHGESADACINPLHCLIEVNHDRSGENTDTPDYDALCGVEGEHHKHDMTRDDCQLNRVDITIPLRDQSSGKTLLPQDISLLTLFTTISQIDTHSECNHHIVVHPDYRERPQSIYIDYIVSAIPARAPSFMV